MEATSEGVGEELERRQNLDRAAGIVATDGVDASDQNEKGRLKGILGFMGVTQQPSADTINERTVARDQDGEGALVPTLTKAIKQLTIGQLAIVTANAGLKQVAQHILKRRAGHDAGST